MTYDVYRGQGRRCEAKTIDEAISKAAAMLYMRDKSKSQAKAALEQGKPFTVAYGFETVTMAPKVHV